MVADQHPGLRTDVNDVGDVGGVGANDQINELGRALLVVGDQWNMLIVRAAFRRLRRFNEFRDALGVSDGVLASRLDDLVADGVMSTAPYSAHPNRVEYVLTEEGRDLWPIFVATWRWERAWVSDDQVGRPDLVHHRCGNTTVPDFGCATCGVVGVTHRDTTAISRPDATFAQSNPSRRYRRSSVVSSGGDTLHPTLLRLLGDRWSVAVLAGSLLGLRRFGEMQDELGISPHLLTQRLSEFVEMGVLRQVPIKTGGKRHAYQLSPKGYDLLPTFALTNEWSHRWFADRRGPALTLLHQPDGHELLPTWFCDVCGRRLTREEIEFR